MGNTSENTSDNKPNWRMQFFTFKHLPGELALISENFSRLALWVDENLRDNPEKEQALSLLLQAKDSAVRARLFK